MLVKVLCKAEVKVESNVQKKKILGEILITVKGKKAETVLDHNEFLIPS